MQTFILKLKITRQKLFYLSQSQFMSNLQLTLHVAGEPVLVGEAVIRPLLSEGDLHTVLHLDVIDLGEAPDEQVDHDQGGVICNQRVLNARIRGRSAVICYTDYNYWN